MNWGLVLALSALIAYTALATRAILADKLILLFIKFTTKGGKIMMAMFFAQRIILGKSDFSEVPAKLRAAVAEILKDSGLPDLVPAEFQ